MNSDPTAEIKRIRHELGAEDGFDIERIFARLRRIETESGRKVICRAPRRVADNKAIRPSAR